MRTVREDADHESDNEGGDNLEVVEEEGEGDEGVDSDASDTKRRHLGSFTEYTSHQDHQRKLNVRKKAAGPKSRRPSEATNVTAGTVSTAHLTFQNVQQRLSPYVYVTQFLINLFAILFLTLAALGGVLHLLTGTGNASGGSNLPISDGNDSIEIGDSTGAEVGSGSASGVEDINWSLAREAAVLAFLTTWQAVRLWSQLVISIIIPTSHKTFSITKDGWVAMQPSLKISWEWLKNAPPVIKATLAGISASIVLVIISYREIKRRKYVEKMIRGYYRVQDYVGYSYEKFANRVAERSLFLVQLLPHFLFLVAIGVLHYFAADIVSDFSKGVGGWMLVIGIPVIFSTMALVVYDQVYNERLRQLASTKRRLNRRRPSQLPTPGLDAESATKNKRGIFGNLYNVLAKPFVDLVAGKDVDKDDGSAGLSDSEEMRPYLGTAKQYKTMRGVRPLQYPKFLDSDDEFALQQYGDLVSVLYWLRYWTILAFVLMWEQLPITGHMLGVLPWWPNLRMFLSLWLQVPGTHGADLAFEFVVPLVGKYWQKIELKAPNQRTQNYALQLFLSALPMSEKYKTYISEIAETGGVLLLSALPFMFTPAFITGIGCVLLGLVRPMYTGIVSVLSVESAMYNANKRLMRTKISRQRKEELKKHNAKSRLLRNISKTDQKSSVAGTSLHCTAWLEYWVVYTSFMFVHGLISVGLYWLPFWSQIQLGLVLWLQLPYFRGARRVFKVMLAAHYRFRALLLKEDTIPASGVPVVRTVTTGAPQEYEHEEQVNVNSNTGRESTSSPVSDKIDFAAMARDSKVRKLSDSNNMFEPIDEGNVGEDADADYDKLGDLDVLDAKDNEGGDILEEKGDAKIKRKKSSTKSAKSSISRRSKSRNVRDQEEERCPPTPPRQLYDITQAEPNKPPVSTWWQSVFGQ